MRNRVDVIVSGHGVSDFSFFFLSGKARLSSSPVYSAHPKRLPSREWRRGPHGWERKKAKSEGGRRETNISFALLLTSKSESTTFSLLSLFFSFSLTSLFSLFRQISCATSFFFARSLEAYCCSTRVWFFFGRERKKVMIVGGGF